MAPVEFETTQPAPAPSATIGLRRDEVFTWLVAANSEANEFARAGLSCLLLLHGGAILVFAPIGQIFAVRVSEVRFLALFSLGTFALGLFLAAIGYLMGFLTNSRLSYALQLQLTQQNTTAVTKEIAKQNRLRLMGMVAAMLSVGLFIAGAIAGALALYAGGAVSPPSMTFESSSEPL